MSTPAVHGDADERVPPRPVPLWRREPYRLLFPEALLLAWAGVVWLLYALGAVSAHPSDFHAVAQIEGFVACIAAGFLFTFIPRRTGARPAGPIAIALAMLAPRCPLGTRSRLPAGYALAALLPPLEEAAVHVVYVGAFALTALSVAYHVALVHGGDAGILTGRPRAIVAMAVLFMGTPALRWLVDLDRAREHLWLGVAAFVCSCRQRCAGPRWCCRGCAGASGARGRDGPRRHSAPTSCSCDCPNRPKA